MSDCCVNLILSICYVELASDLGMKWIRLVTLQMVSKLDIGWCTSENVEHRRRVDTGQCANEDAGPKEVDCEIPHQLERETSANKDAMSRRRMYCEIPHRLERETSASEYAGS